MPTSGYGRTSRGRKAMSYRSGVHFSCPDCGLLWRDDPVHGERLRSVSPCCGADLLLVGKGNAFVGYAKWFRCQSCSGLHMLRRGEIVPTTPRSGFDEFT